MDPAEVCLSLFLEPKNNLLSKRNKLTAVFSALEPERVSSFQPQTIGIHGASIGNVSVIYGLEYKKEI